MSNVSDDSSSYGYFDFTEYCADQSFATLAVFNISLTIIGLITGIFLLAVVVKNPALRGDKFLLLNQLLCVSIVLLSVAGIIYTEEAIYPCWYIGRFFCKLFHFSTTFLTNVSTFLLVCLAVQQLNRYRRKLTTFFSSTHQRWVITIVMLWVIAALVSIPELVLANVLRFDEQGVLSLCGVYKYNHLHKITLSVKILFIEYISPFLILLIVIVATGFYVLLVRSQYTTFGVTSGESLVERDLKHPRHFALLVCLTVVNILGYFPLYSYELAAFKEGIANTGRFHRFWLGMDQISIFFVLVPPAVVPTFMMLLSWPHRETVAEIYRGMTVSIFDESKPTASGGAKEEEEFADVKA